MAYNWQDQMTPPDLLGAGLGDPNEDNTSLLGSLKSIRGNMPNMALMQMLAMPQQQSNPFMEALAGGVAMMNNQPNPIIAQNIAQQAQQQKMIGLADTILNHQFMQQWRTDQEQRAREKFQFEQSEKARTAEAAKDKAALDIMTGLYKDLDVSPGWKAANAQTYAQLVKKATGWDVPAPQVMQKIPENERGLLFAEIAGGATDQALQDRFPWATPDIIKSFRTIPDNPDIRAALKLPSKLDIDTKAAELISKNAKNWADLHGYKLDSPEYNYASQFVRDKAGRALYEMKDDSPSDLSILAQARAYAESKKEAEEIRKERRATEAALLRDQLITDRQIAAEGRTPIAPTHLFADLNTMSVVASPTKTQFASQPGRYRPLGQEQVNLLGFMPMAEKQVDQLDKLIPELLAKETPENLRKAIQSGVATKVLRNDPQWAQFQRLITDSNVELTRIYGGAGQFRTSLLDYLSKAAMTSRDTQEVAHTIVDTMRTDILNRRTGIMTQGSPQVGNPASQLQDYKMPAPAGFPSKSSPLSRRLIIRREGESRDERWELMPGESLPPGARVIKEYD